MDPFTMLLRLRQPPPGRQRARGPGRGSAPRERDHRGGDHPVPSRTRQLSPPSPRVLGVSPREARSSRSRGALQRTGGREAPLLRSGAGRPRECRCLLEGGPNDHRFLSAVVIKNCAESAGPSYMTKPADPEAPQGMGFAQAARWGRASGSAGFAGCLCGFQSVDGRPVPRFMRSS